MVGLREDDRYFYHPGFGFQESRKRRRDVFQPCL